MTDVTPSLGYLPETPSQTAGPYVHIGLIPKQAGFDIFENNLGEMLVGPETKGEGRRGHKPMAPHLNFWIAARGINLGLATRMYFGDEDAANAADPVLNIIEQPERRQTLIARREQREGRPVYVFDIRLQGERETVFFDI